MMHTDISGPVNPVALNSERYTQLLTDDLSGAMWVSNLKAKSDAAGSTKEMILHAQRITNKKVVAIRADNAK